MEWKYDTIRAWLYIILLTHLLQPASAYFFEMSFRLIRRQLVRRQLYFSEIESA